ncbi:tenascin [Rhinichthys klamathensis goyatoka]|uniref:tenascin n=1 Tax=Rhinichthys klamathensis goyatoka TaxID=3034132 RepID=UPI0024B53A64|nr:tenascin [Rhinichthys klamathensis goyatoka]
MFLLNMVFVLAFLLLSPPVLSSGAQDLRSQPVKVIISDTCVQDGSGEKEMLLEPGSPLVLTHRIRLVSGSSSDTGSGCQCELDFAALRERMERLEKEVSDLREKCGGPDGCCSSQQSKGLVCTTGRPETDECPDDCSDQGRCVDGKCVCFPGFSGPDCSVPDCPGDCSNRGRCVNGQCVCDPGFSGPDCSGKTCPENCNNRGRCVNGKCVCDSGFAGQDCSVKTCPDDCSKRGQCVDGKCVCESGFTGQDCSSRSCPGDCSDRGQCVNGQCVCESGFTGPDCSSQACPSNCNSKGRCVNGRCVCESGFKGPDCSSSTCPGDCSDRGRCVNGRCVCESGFTGPDCSSSTCPGDCSDRGRCVNGRCVCESGFTGPDCSSRSCPGDCSDRGRCVNGQCVCESGFTGPDCSSRSCPGDCSDRGRCVNGQCVCESGFTGPDCSSQACPSNCNSKGRCVDGKCVCDVGFSGQDCSSKTCPNSCSDRGRCVRGRCVCRRGFTGADCSECQSGLTGENCDTALSAVSRLSTRNISESSVTLSWTPAAVQYDTFIISFTSTKETDQKIISRISGRLNTYTQVGLAAGQEYMVSVTGEKDGMMGTESTTQFTTLVSGPKDLHVVKTSTTTVVVQWEKAQGEIDRYVLSVAPNQTEGSVRLPEMILAPERDSARIQGLQPGRLYDISLVAERGSVRSRPATVQATPGPEPPSDLVFSDVTDSSFTVSWAKPKSKVSGFKITHTHVQEGEPVSVSVDSETLRLDLAPVSPGSSYEVSVASVLGRDESDSITDTVTTLPDPPTDLRVINVTDSKALLLWRPALATVDHYIIEYSSDAAPGITMEVSGNAAEEQLQALRSSTRYSVSIQSRLRDLSSSRATASFSTTGAGKTVEGPRDLKASQVTPRTALLSWKPPVSAITGYKLSYFTDGQEIQEVTVDPTVTELNLSRLIPSSRYTAVLRAESSSTTVSTDFSTGNLRFPFPADCSQEQQNGAQESGIVDVFPQGREGKALMVYCDMETDGGGWTVFQRRKDGKTNFFRSWREYSSGFGALDGEFWLGNELLHNFTKASPVALRVDLRAGDEAVYARYSSFSVDSARKHFTIRVSGYSGTAGDAMSYHNARPFSTHDRDPQPFITRCAMSYRGGWWYKNCHEANLNGLYNTNTNHQGVIWTQWKGKDFSIPFTEMKFRPSSFRP